MRSIRPGPQVQPVDHHDDKKRQVFFRQPFVTGRREKERRLAINVTEVTHRKQAAIRIESMI